MPMKKNCDNLVKIKRWFSIAYKNIIEIIFLTLTLMLFLTSIGIAMFNLCIILFLVNGFNDGIITNYNFSWYYIACASMAFVAILYHKVARKIMFTYPVDYKKHCGVNRNANFYHAMLCGAGIFSDRLFVYVFFFGLLYVEHKLWMSDAIHTPDLMFYVKAGQISVILLGAVDLVVSEVRKTRETLGYGIKVWLELLYLERLDIMRKSTKRRIHSLLTKEKYKDIFNEFGYVVDEMGRYSSASFVEYAKEIDLKNKEHYFQCCYESAMKTAIILKNCDETMNGKIIEYLEKIFVNKMTTVYDDIIKQNVFSYNSGCFSMVTKVQIERCNQIISKYGYEIWYEILENEDIFIRVQRKLTKKQTRLRKFFESLKRSYREMTKE